MIPTIAHSIGRDEEGAEGRGGWHSQGASRMSLWNIVFPWPNMHIYEHFYLFATRLRNDNIAETLLSMFKLKTCH